MEADMRKPMLAAAMLAVMSATAHAQDAPWCFRDFNAAPFSNCIFPTAEPCLAAARIIGGVCERNQRPIGKTAGRTADRTTHKSKARPD
jgi:Protein of unknown function (DUF3551)